MLFEIISTLSMGAIATSSYMYQKKKETDDHERIKVIADELGLKTNKESIRIYRKHKTKNYTEYVYKIPLGVPFKKFEKEKQTFIDGLNNKSRPDLNVKELPSRIKEIDWKDNGWKQLHRIFSKRTRLDKHIEMSYDGMLRVKVFNTGLTDMYEVTTDILGSYNRWRVPIGTTLSKLIVHDFEQSPHMLIGGATDMGKSTILNVIVATLMHNHSRDVSFTLIDLKGGLEFGIYEHLKQTAHFAYDIAGAEEALSQVKTEMETGFDMLRRTGKKDYKQANIRKRHFVIIDEAAELSSSGELDDEVKKRKIACENYIKDIARRGRACGIRLLYSTQYPTKETVSSQVKRNLITRISLPVDTTIASKVVLDEGGAEELPLVQGRSIYKHHRSVEMQASYIDDRTISDIIEPHLQLESNIKGDFDAPFKTKSNVPTRKHVVKFEET